MRRIFPDPAPTSVAEALDAFEAEELEPGGERPYVITNFVLTVDGRATIEGRSGPIGSELDTEMLIGLRARADATLVGAGTLRVERYGRLLPDPELRELRVRRGLEPDPLAVIASASGELPWDAGLFTCGHGEVVVVTASGTPPPRTATPVEHRHHPGGVDLAEALRALRTERGIRLLLCEGGPRLHHDLLAAGLVDELFLTRAPKLGAGAGPGLIEGKLDAVRELELIWLLESEGELFARYRTRS